MIRPICLTLVLSTLSILYPTIARANDAPSPNIVLIFADDMGYSDVGVYGSEGYETPHLDRMAAEGIRLTDFYSAQPVCSASRAALLTGCYANRVGIHGALGPKRRHGLNPDETTLAEICKQQGYATAIFGKWHLGDAPEFLPTRHGFDTYFGLPYSNDMWPFHPRLKNKTPEEARAVYPDLPLLEDDRIVDAEVTPEDQRTLTTRYTEKAVEFIEQNRERPFFLYVPHSMPHVPLYVSDKFQDKTEQGRYGDVIAEIDWSVGQILDSLKKNNLDEKTLVIFTSDNGPWKVYGNHGGTCRPLRGSKGTTFEGGVREPMIARWPGNIPHGRVGSVPAMTIDILPTVAKLIGAKLPSHTIDGRDIWPLLSDAPGAKSPHEAYFFYYGDNELQAVRYRKWKLHFPHSYRVVKEAGADGLPGKYDYPRTGLELYNLKDDIGETTNVAEQHQDVVGRIKGIADEMREELGDSLQGKKKGTGSREPGRI